MSVVWLLRVQQVSRSVAAMCSDLVPAIGRDSQIRAASYTCVSGSRSLPILRSLDAHPLPPAAFRHGICLCGAVFRERGRIVFPHAAGAARAGGARGRPVPVAGCRSQPRTGERLSVVCKPPPVAPMTRLSRVWRYEPIFRDAHLTSHAVDGDAAADNSEDPCCMHAGQLRCGVVMIMLAGVVCRRWA